MQIELPKETIQKVDEASKVLGMEEKEIVNRAVLVFLDMIGKYVSLKNEMKEWDMLSDEALANFEKSL